jgi:hypothetical protein
MKGYDIVHIVAEDTKNPVINALLLKYPTIKFKLQSLEEDIRLILRAKNCVASFGTFIPSLLFVSNNIKNLFTFSYAACRSTFYGNFNRQIIDLDDYKKMMDRWINSPEQRKTMLSA